MTTELHLTITADSAVEALEKLAELGKRAAEELTHASEKAASEHPDAFKRVLRKTLSAGFPRGSRARKDFLAN